MNDQNDHGNQENVFPTAEPKDDTSMFHDIALTVSREERRDFMLGRYGGKFGWLKKLFGWDATEKRTNRTRCVEPSPKPLIETGSVLPLLRLSLSGICIAKGKRFAVLSTNIPVTTIRDIAQKLNAAPSRLEHWRKAYPALYARAQFCVSACLARPLTVNSIASLKRAQDMPASQILVGDGEYAGEIEFVHLEIDRNGWQVSALLIALYGECPSGWLRDASQYGQLDSQMHPFTASLLCAQFDPGLKWTAVSHDGSACKLELEDGIRQVLPRPGIPLSKKISAVLWKLLGDLSPDVGKTVSLLGKTRENAAGLGVVLPRCHPKVSFAILQSGLSSAVRRVVAVKPTFSNVDTGHLLKGLIKTCGLAMSKASGESARVRFVLNAFFGLEALLTSTAHKAGANNTQESFGFRAGPFTGRDRALDSVTSFVADVDGGLLPSEDVVQSLRKYFLNRKLEEEPERRLGFRLLLWLKPRLVILILRSLFSSRSGRYEPRQDGNTWERDSYVIEREKYARAKAKVVAETLSEKESIRTLIDVFKDAVVFGFTKKNQDPQPRPGNHLPRVITMIHDFIMFIVKQKTCGIVLEERLWETISRGCNLTIVADLDEVFRFPANDLHEPPVWLMKRQEDPGDLVEIRLDGLFDRIRDCPQLRSQIEAIKDICGCAEAAGIPLRELAEFCRVRWDNNRSIAQRVSAKSIIRFLRPPENASSNEKQSWWLKLLGIEKGAAFIKQRELLRKLFDTNAEEAMTAILKVASANLGTYGYDPRTSVTSVWISKSEVDRMFERLTRPAKYDGPIPRADDREYTPEIATGSTSSKQMESEEMLLLLVRRLDGELIRTLQEENQKDNLEEFVRLLQSHYQDFGPADFSAMIAEAIRARTAEEQMAIRKFIEVCIQGELGQKRAQADLAPEL